MNKIDVKMYCEAHNVTLGILFESAAWVANDNITKNDIEADLNMYIKENYVPNYVKEYIGSGIKIL